MLNVEEFRRFEAQYDARIKQVYEEWRAERGKQGVLMPAWEKLGEDFAVAIFRAYMAGARDLRRKEGVTLDKAAEEYMAIIKPARVMDLDTARKAKKD
jgi:hypothetical protein